LGCGLGFFLSITGFALIAVAVVASHGIVMVAAGTAASGLVLRLVFTAGGLSGGFFRAPLFPLCFKRVLCPPSPHPPPPPPTTHPNAPRTATAPTPLLGCRSKSPADPSADQRASISQRNRSTQRGAHTAASFVARLRVQRGADRLRLPITRPMRECGAGPRQK